MVISNFWGHCIVEHCCKQRDETWIGRTELPGEIEDGMLEATPAPRRPESRLSCQITASSELDGLVLHVPAE